MEAQEMFGIFKIQAYFYRFVKSLHFSIGNFRRNYHQKFYSKFCMDSSIFELRGGDHFKNLLKFIIRKGVYQLITKRNKLKGRVKKEKTSQKNSLVG
jgi:hypothetical protein